MEIEAFRGLGPLLILQKIIPRHPWAQIPSTNKRNKKNTKVSVHEMG